ncbi:MAG: 23S rRNA (guanosine(2251)-2'-O)-methyltransferase RlmB [Bacillota bacterium]|nr:23S rRNA (guanosine(2251)-2'-O)-methyltransferase RlmB [Bacillota bacterium]
MDQDKGFIVGKNAIMEALKARRQLNKIFLATGATSGALKDLLALAKAQKVPVKQVERRKLDEMCPDVKHQGIVASVPPMEYTDFHKLVEDSLAITNSPLLVMVDEIEDPHNLGAIIRSVEGLGGQGVIIPKHRAVPLTEGVNKAAAGTLSHVPVARVTNLVQAVDLLKEKGFWIAAADAKAAKLAYEVDLQGPLVLVIGGESKGVGRLLQESCDLIVRLPMEGKINSLNASVAAGILIYEIMRQRQAKK